MKLHGAGPQTGTAPILVPLDGSDFSEQALPLACSIADRWHAPLRLARVHVRLASEVHAADGLVVMDNQRDVEARDRDAAYLERQRTLSTEAGTEAVLLQGTSVPGALATDAEQSHARLVVMTTHARAGLPRLLRGSVASGVVRRSPAPVLLVRPGHLDASREFSRVLVPLDGSELSRAILQQVALVAERGALLVLFTVIEPKLPAWPDAMGAVLPDDREREAQAAAWLEEQAGPLREQGFEVECRVCVSRRCAHQVLAVGTALGVDLIALATHGRSGLARAALGSVAEEVVRGAEVPVLLHHPLRRAEAGREEETR